MNESNIKERAPSLNKSIQKDFNARKENISDKKNKTVTFEGNNNWN